MKTLTPTSLVVTWSDGKTEDLVKVLPEYLQDELCIYLAELEDLRAEHDAGYFEEELIGVVERLRFVANNMDDRSNCEQVEQAINKLRALIRETDLKEGDKE